MYAVWPGRTLLMPAETSRGQGLQGGAGRACAWSVSGRGERDHSMGSVGACGSVLRLRRRLSGAYEETIPQPAALFAYHPCSFQPAQGQLARAPVLPACPSPHLVAAMTPGRRGASVGPASTGLSPVVKRSSSTPPDSTLSQLGRGQREACGPSGDMGGCWQQRRQRAGLSGRTPREQPLLGAAAPAGLTSATGRGCECG